MDEVLEIKRLRKKLGITQSELAKQANVSQSLIAKIESGKLDPSYGNAKKIFETLAALEKGIELYARDIMYKKIIFLQKTDTLKDSIMLMRKHNISQMPVLLKDKIVGYISESLILDRILEGDTSMQVGEIMESSPPILPPGTKQSVLVNLLRHFPLVIIEEKGELIGIVTKADLLRMVY
jgi:predicted transcriptional regulator